MQSWQDILEQSVRRLRETGNAAAGALSRLPDRFDSLAARLPTRSTTSGSSEKVTEPARPRQKAPIGSLHVVDLPEKPSAAGMSSLLHQVEGGRVALVIPAASPQTRSLSRSGAALLQVLRRQADAQGLDVALVTRSEGIRQLAGDAGLPVFGSIEGAQNRAWPRLEPRLGAAPPPPARDRRHPASQQRRGRVPARFRLVVLSQGQPRPMPPVLEVLWLLIVLGLSILAVSALLAFVVPLAEVTVVPAQEPLAAQVTLLARSDVETVNQDDFIIPARRIGQRVEGEGTVDATGSRSVPDEAATGVVVFTNRQPTEQEIPAGAIVATSTGANIRFQTTEDALLPGGVGAQVTIPVESLESGSAGNVRAFAINTVEGSLALSVNAINPQDMAGGSVKQAPVITLADKERLRSQVLQQVTQKAYLALGELLEEGEFVPPETVGTLVVAETYDRFTDEEASQVSLRLRLLATALAVDGAAADELALNELSNQVSRRGRLLTESVSYNRSPVRIEEYDDVTLISFETMASGVIVREIDPAAVRASIRGHAVGEAVGIIRENWRLQSEPELTLGPDWLLAQLRRFDYAWLPYPVADRIPWLPFRIRVRVLFS